MKRFGYLAVILILALGWMLAGCARQDSPPMGKLEDLTNKRIGVGSGTVYDKFVVEKFPAATAVRYIEQADLILAIKGEKIDAAITNFAAAKVMLKESPEIGILTDQVLSFPVGMGFQQKQSRPARSV